MARVLVTEELAPRGLEALRAAGHDVDVRLGLGADGLSEAVRGAAALVVRSATKVTAEVLAAAGEGLVVVGRAGIGLDNVDVAAATRRGVVVVNAPESNVVSAAEQAMALLLAQARNLPQAHAALKAGRWERSRWEGVELHGKVLGVVGLGRVGTLVAQRAGAFGMRLVAYDPYVSAERARALGVELVGLDELLGQADFVSVHLPKTPETAGLIDAAALAQAKPGIRIVNTARGGIVDEEALAEAVRSGRVAGAGLDVFAAEPTTASPLFGLDSVVVTPHLGASTVEAQDKAGATVAEQVVLALAGELAPYAVNLAASGASEAVRPFLPLAERLGRFFASLVAGAPSVLEVSYEGGLADHDTRVLTLAVLKGLFAAGAEPVSYINAPRLAEERGVEVRETRTSAAQDYVNLVALRGGGHAVAGTLAGPRGQARIVMVDDHFLEVPPAPHMLVILNDDRPGMIGRIGTAVGDAGVSITDMAFGPSPSAATALMVLSTDQAVPPEVVAKLATAPGVLEVRAADA